MRKPRDLRVWNEKTHDRFNYAWCDPEETSVDDVSGEVYELPRTICLAGTFDLDAKQAERLGKWLINAAAWVKEKP